MSQTWPISHVTSADQLRRRINALYEGDLIQTEKVDKAYVDALNVDADKLDGLDSTDFAAASHTHNASDVTAGTFTDPRISQSSVQQHIDKTLIDGLNVDADTLDGMHASSFGQISANNVWTGSADFQKGISLANGGAGLTAYGSMAGASEMWGATNLSTTSGWLSLSGAHLYMVRFGSGFGPPHLSGYAMFWKQYGVEGGAFTIINKSNNVNLGSSEATAGDVSIEFDAANNRFRFHTSEATTLYVANIIVL